MSDQEYNCPPINDFGCIADVYDELVDWAPYGRWVDALESRLRTWGLAPGDWLLDAACGTGLSSLPWARRGYKVVGADVNERMLRRARRRALEEGLDVQFARQDVTDLRPPRTFDAVICMHSGLDYLDSDADLCRAFCSMRSCLRPDGLLAFDKCLDVPEFYSEDYTESRSLSCGTAEFSYRWDRGRRLFCQQLVVRRSAADAAARTEVTYHLHATPPDKLRRWLQKAGFEELEPVGQFSILDPGMGIFRAV
ncbi:MAG: class I SAM-dependent methyltransferase [Candidatus Brocadiia bacterium]